MALITPAFASQYRIVLFDHVGAGKSDLTRYSAQHYDSLQAYATDVLEILEELGIEQAIYVGHSVSAMIGILAAIRAPERFDRLVLVGPSPCYINDGDYTGGFTRADIAAMLDSLDSNHLGWSAQMAPVIMGTPDRPEMAAELTNSFCRTDPDITRHFARVTFLSDNRADLAGVAVPTLVLQCDQDVIASEVVGRYVHEQIPGSVFTKLSATGHCPNLSAPEETTAAIRAFLSP